MPINRDQWELGAKTKHQSIGVFNLSATQQPVQDSVGASGYAYTSSTTCMEQVKSTSIAVSTRVRLSGSVGSNNLTTASSMQHRLISLQQTRIFFCRLKTKVWKGGLVETPHNLHAEQVSEGIPPARELLAQDCNSSSAKKCR